MIDYNLIANSIVHYTNCGYKRIESPWMVSEYIDNITKPVDRPHYQLKHNNKCLVASGEQSFLYLYLKEYIPKGKFQTVTPCFRSDEYDMFHEKTFIKNELIITDEVNTKSLYLMIDIAKMFFKDNVPNPKKINVVKTDIGFDIEYDGIELGSYGIRECDFLKWIYGTGCAEPRLSKIKYGK